MTPRPDMVAISGDATLAKLRALFQEQEYSRIPVYGENLDNILGLVYVKDLIQLRDARRERARCSRICRNCMRPATFVPETKRVAELLKEFQRKQTQIAIVVDEYGGTAGLATIEDLLEEIVGEIRDEYDVETEPVVEEAGWRLRLQRQGELRRGARAPGCRDRAGGIRDRRRLRPDARRPCAGGRARRSSSTGMESRCSRPSAAASTKVRFMRREPQPAETEPTLRRADPIDRRAEACPCRFRSSSAVRTPANPRSSTASSATKVAIVSDKPQTTRNRIVAVKNLPGGQMVFVDTPASIVRCTA